MSNNAKHNDELFSMRSLESAYLPHMFSEHENAHKKLDHDGSDSFDSISTSHKKSSCYSGDISIVDAQYSHRVSPYNVTKDGTNIASSAIACLWIYCKYNFMKILAPVLLSM